VAQLQLRPPAHLVSPRARWYWTLRALLGWMALLLGELFVWAGMEDAGVRSGAAALVTVTAVVAVGHLVVMPQWRYRVHRWESTDTAVYTQSGWFTQERRVAPIARIQTVDTHRGPLEQLFGLANVTITTASAAGPLEIHGLAARTAEELVEELTVRTQRENSDGT
jgi:membrane protein YdbS with pleckstrin-like domain